MAAENRRVEIRKVKRGKEKRKRMETILKASWNNVAEKPSCYMLTISIFFNLPIF